MVLTHIDISTKLNSSHINITTYIHIKTVAINSLYYTGLLFTYLKVQKQVQ